MFKKIMMKLLKRKNVTYTSNNMRIADFSSVAPCVAMYPRELLDRIKKSKNIYIKSNYN